MTLQRLSLLLVTATLAGFAALSVLAAVTVVDIQSQQQQMQQLLDVENRIDELSVASDQMMLSGASEQGFERYKTRAAEVQKQLRELGPNDRWVRRAVDQIDDMVASVAKADPTSEPTEPLGLPGDGHIGPLAIPLHSHAAMSDVATGGMDLDDTLSKLIDERQDAITSHVNRLIGGFVTAVLAFAGLGLGALTLMHRRLSGPVRQIEATIDDVLAGDRQVRAPIQGRDELGKLAAAFNAMLDQRDQGDAELAAQTRALEEREAMLTESQRIANIGSWRYFPETGELVYSEQAFRILDFDPARRPGIEAFYQRVHEADRDRVRAADEAALNGQTRHTLEYRIVREDADVRQIREEAERRPRDDGKGWFLAGTLQDVTEQKALEAEHHRLRERLGTILESVTDAVVSLDANWRFGYVNNEAARLLALPSPGQEDRDLWRAVPALNSPQVATELTRAMDHRVTVALEERFEPLDRWLDVRAYPSQEGLTLLMRDTTEHHRMLNRLMDQEARLSASHEELKRALASRQMLINSLPAHVALLDAEGTILDVNQQWCDFGAQGGNQDPNFSVGRNYIAICEAATNSATEGASEVAEGLRTVLRGERDIFAREYPCHSPTEEQWFRVVANRIQHDDSEGGTGASGAVVMHVDITERKRAEQALNRIAYEDSLTGVASRQGFTEAVNQQVAALGWQPHARVVMLDVHHQHDINEAYGFEAGDELLRGVAQRLREAAGDEAVIGRSGGDEFVAFLPAVDEADAEAACQAIDAAFEERFPLGDYAIERRGSFGYSSLGAEPRDTEQLLREAEMALFYAGPAGGGNAWAVYTSDLDEQTRQRVQVTDELRQAMTNNEFELHFQPKVTLDSGELVGAEALLRWWHPERGLQSPGLFVPIAEQSQLIGPIGDWVLNDACRRLAAWQAAGLDIVRISVNVSVVQFADGDFPDAVGNALYANGIDPSALTLEITESVFEQNATSLHRQLHELHDMGVRLSLDDFGTGYSSLLYLQQYPFDEIKIDKGFVMAMESEPYNARVVSSVIGIAEALGAGVVAEGVESQSVADALTAMDCHVGQGFYYSMPLAGEDFSWLLETRSPLPVGRETPPTPESKASNHGGGS
jgi:diguanylate cyclase (GGDEF)-like protein